MSIEAKIKNYIKEKGIGQKELSMQTGITTTKLNLSLNEKRRLNFTEYEYICGTLNLNAGAFLEAKRYANELR